MAILNTRYKIKLYIRLDTCSYIDTDSKIDMYMNDKKNSLSTSENIFKKCLTV